MPENKKCVKLRDGTILCTICLYKNEDDDELFSESIKSPERETCNKISCLPL
jgi:hypothetical protein